MTALFFPSNSSIYNQKLYCYTNNSEKIAIVQINGLVNQHCERVVFPGEKFLFQADDNCELEISQQTNTGVIKDTIACSQLRVREGNPQACA